MKKHKNLFFVIVLAMMTVFLSYRWWTSSKVMDDSKDYQTEETQSNKAVEKKEVEKKSTTHSHAQSTKTETEPNKKIPGIDQPTDDGFLLTSEAQITQHTSSGIIVNHGNHQHFFFYDDLKNSKWEYLIPKDHRTTLMDKKQKDGVVARTSGSVTVATHLLDDGYVFDSNDIVAEDEKGYTVRHGDHYHYVLKTEVPSATPIDFVNQPTTQPFMPLVLNQVNGIAGIDFATSDGFLFDGTNIAGTTQTGILVKHGHHLHPISFDTLQHTKWHYLVDRYQAPSSSQKPPEKTMVSQEEEYEQKRAYLAKELNIAVSSITKVISNGKVGLEYPHEDHKHLILLEEIDVTKPLEDPDDHVLEKQEGETFEERKERLIKAYMDRFKVDRGKISVNGNYMSVSHGDHAHVYKIDPDLPDDPERDTKTETTNLEIEQTMMYGPFYREGSLENLTRFGVYQNYHVSGIKNIKNFVLMQFNTNSPYGDFEINGKKTKRIYYLVRKDLNWEDLPIMLPKVVSASGKVFKGWSRPWPTSGKMARVDQSFYADFDTVRKQPTKKVYTPSDDISDIDLTNYVAVKYTTLFNGRLELAGVVQGGFTYYIDQNITWKEAREQGLVEPTPVPNKQYEFIEYRRIFTAGSGENDQVNLTVNMAAFGTTAPVIGPYLAQNPDDPTALKDPSRHPNYYWHDPKKYVAVAFKADEHGTLISRAGRGKTAVYLIRKGLSLKEAGITPPVTQGDEGYVAIQNDELIANYHKPVMSDTVYTMRFAFKSPDHSTKQPSDDLLAPDPSLVGNHGITPIHTPDWLPGDQDPPTRDLNELDDLLAPDPALAGNHGTTPIHKPDWLPGDQEPPTREFNELDDLLAPDPALAGNHGTTPIHTPDWLPGD